MPVSTDSLRRVVLAGGMKRFLHDVTTAYAPKAVLSSPLPSKLLNICQFYAPSHRMGDRGIRRDGTFCLKSPSRFANFPAQVDVFMQRPSISNRVRRPKRSHAHLRILLQPLQYRIQLFFPRGEHGKDPRLSEVPASAETADVGLRQGLTGEGGNGGRRHAPFRRGEDGEGHGHARRRGSKARRG